MSSVEGPLFIPLGPLYHLPSSLHMRSGSYSVDDDVKVALYMLVKFSRPFFWERTAYLIFLQARGYSLREYYTTINHHEESINQLEFLSPHIPAGGARSAWLIPACSYFLAQGAYCYPFEFCGIWLHLEGFSLPYLERLFLSTRISFLLCSLNKRGNELLKSFYKMLRAYL